MGKISKETSKIRDLIEILKSDQKYIFVKFIDYFLEEVHPVYQKSILKWVVSEIPNDRWKELVGDPYAYVDLLRSILFYHSGDEVRKEPTLHNLAELLGQYLRSNEFRDARDVINNDKFEEKACLKKMIEEDMIE